jgi:hypothetical protein
MLIHMICAAAIASLALSGSASAAGKAHATVATPVAINSSANKIYHPTSSHRTTPGEPVRSFPINSYRNIPGEPIRTIPGNPVKPVR